MGLDKSAAVLKKKQRERERENLGPFKTASITANAADISFGDGEITAILVYLEGEK